MNELMGTSMFNVRVGVPICTPSTAVGAYCRHGTGAEAAVGTRDLVPYGPGEFLTRARIPYPDPYITPLLHPPQT